MKIPRQENHANDEQEELTTSDKLIESIENSLTDAERRIRLSQAKVRALREFLHREED
jgi:hypothetical protein